MRVARHRLHDEADLSVPFVRSPNHGGAMTPRYLVMHYTAGRSAAESIRWLSSPDARASAHLVIARDGTVTQLVPFDRIAWHAGPSRWEGIQGLNQHSIGIELDNAGRLERQGEAWRAWFGGIYGDDEVLVAAHKHETRTCGWHLYTPQQLEVALEVARVLIRKYDLRDVLGHEDISPGRKSDPGPAFPMESFRSRLFGRSEDVQPVFATTGALNIRRGAGTHHEKLSVSPLAPGTRLEVVGAQGSWRHVTVLGDVAGDGDVQGWVHGDFVRRVE